jgi:hypothetical protein
MTCNNFEKAVLFAESGELSAAQGHALREHLTHCRSCKAFQEDLRALGTLTRQSLSTVPEGPSETVMGRILAAADAHHRERKEPSPRFLRHPLLAMAAGLMLLLGTLYVAHRARLAPSPSDLRAARIAECSSLLAALMELESNPRVNTEARRDQTDLQTLARQLLILQEMSVDDDLAESATLPEAHRPTTLQWRSNRAMTARTCG